MLLKRSLKRILLSSLVLVLLLTIYLIPGKKDEYHIKSTIEYVNKDLKTHPIFLLDNNNYLSKTDIIINSKTKKDLAYELMEYIIINSKLEDKIPSGFRALIPEDTIINSIEIIDDTIKIDFSKELLKTSKEYEEKIIEAIIYNLTSISDIKKVIIFINGEIINYLPQNKIYLPSTLTREFGINKEYNITNLKNINKTTIYYVGMFNNDIYYTPITKVSNNQNNKIEIIIEELIKGDKNVYSFLNNNTKLIDSNIDDNILALNFNEYILDNIETESLNNDVLNTISLSIYDNYDIDEILFKVNGQEFSKIEKKVLNN